MEFGRMIRRDNDGDAVPERFNASLTCPTISAACDLSYGCTYRSFIRFSYVNQPFRDSACCIQLAWEEVSIEPESYLDYVNPIESSPRTGTINVFQKSRKSEYRSRKTKNREASLIDLLEC